ncbi:hypothetical protein DYH09_12460 [bacterium CPR1]|nr:hypothetical protein [bacterium CPR1]
MAGGGGQQQQGNPVVNLIEGLKGLLQNVQNVAMASQGIAPPEPVDSAGPPQVTVTDRLDHFQEEGDGQRLMRRYEDGTVRTENVASGVIMEERPDGSLYVSLAEGRLIHQAAPGEPLLAYDSVNGGPPRVAQASRVYFEADAEPTVALHFEDDCGVHFVELETLRYFRLTRPR